MDDIVTGTGPFRVVQDDELRQIWYLVPQTGHLFEIISITSNPPPGSDSPAITPLLRRMLYLVRLNPSQLQRLVTDITALQSDRQMLAIGARLLSLTRQVYRSPWAFPGVLEEVDLIRYRDIFRGVTGRTDLAANVTSASPIAIIMNIAKIPLSVNVPIINSAYAASLINRNYGAYLQKINIELALRGRNPDLLP